MIPNGTYHCPSYRNILFPPSLRTQNLSVISMLHLNVTSAFPSLFFRWIFPKKTPLNKFLCVFCFAFLPSKNFHTFFHSMPRLRICGAIPPSKQGFHDVHNVTFNSSLLSNPCIYPSHYFLF
jgi:hypothetical protein